jgi:hypothetical protein
MDHHARRRENLARSLGEEGLDLQLAYTCNRKRIKHLTYDPKAFKR